MIDQGNYIVSGIKAIEADQMNIAKYKRYDHEQRGPNDSYEGKKKKYKEIQEKQKEDDNPNAIKERKERSLEDHMMFLIWTGGRKMNEVY